MTILRLPGPGRLGTEVRLATQDDTSVAGGFLAVKARTATARARQLAVPATVSGTVSAR